MPFPSRAQSLELALDDMPVVAAALLDALQGSAPFTARAEVKVTYSVNPKPTLASGICAWQARTLRWDVNLSSINGPLVSTQATAAVTQLKLGPVVLLARGRPGVANLLLTGAKAHLETELPDLKPNRNGKRTRVGEEQVGGENCLKERASFRAPKGTVEVLMWKSKAGDNLPVQARVKLDDATVVIRFLDVNPHKLAAARFEVPANYTRHAYLEDLLQSILVERMKSRLGLPGVP